VSLNSLQEGRGSDVYVDEIRTEALLKVVSDGVIGNVAQHHHVVHSMLARISLPAKAE